MSTMQQKCEEKYDREYGIQLSDYEHQLEHLKAAMSEASWNKFTLIHFLYQNGHVLQEHVTPLIKKIERKEGESDFAITPLIRCLYYGELEKTHQLRTERVQQNFHHENSSSPSSLATKEDVDNENNDREIKNVAEILENHTSDEHTTDFISSVHVEGVDEKASSTTDHCDEHHFGESTMDEFEYFEIRPSQSLQIELSPKQREAEINTMKIRILDTLKQFPFWPSAENYRSMKDMVFWSENHLFMTLGSAYLYYQYQSHFCGDSSGLTSQDKIQQSRIESLLIIYLRAHEHFSGIYEAGSHIYLPYSIAALLNLSDFAISPEISMMAENIVNRIVYYLMLGTDPWKGVANLTASARNFPRARQRNYNHNINCLVKVMNKGVNIDAFGASYISGFLTTTSWRPKPEAFAALHMYSGIATRLPLSHTVETIEQCYVDQFNHAGTGGYITEDDLMPLYWSAGLVTHPEFAQRTYQYVTRYSLQNNKHLRTLFMFGKSITGSVMNHMTHFSSGQVYLDMKLNVYKRPGLVLSSFELYNPHKCGFQQSPWMANIGGVPVWSRSGRGAESVAGFGIHNTHNPAVQQRGNVLLATYVSPPDLRATLTGLAFSDNVFVMWPEAFFEQKVIVMTNTTFAESKAMIPRKIEEVLQQRREKDKQCRSPFPIFNAAYNTLSLAASVVGKSGTEIVNSSHIASLSIDEQLQIMLENGSQVWQIGYRQRCYIALFMTGKWYINDDNDTKDIYFQADPSSSRKSLRRYWTEYKKTNVLVVVGHREDYKDINEFVDGYLCKFRMEGEKNGFKVTFPDFATGAQTTLCYSYSGVQ